MLVKESLGVTNRYAAALALVNYLRKEVPGMSGEDCFEVSRRDDGKFAVIAAYDRYAQFPVTDQLDYARGLAQGWCAALEWENS